MHGTRALGAEDLDEPSWEASRGPALEPGPASSHLQAFLAGVPPPASPRRLLKVCVEQGGRGRW